MARSDTHQRSCEDDGFREELNPSYKLHQHDGKIPSNIQARATKLLRGDEVRNLLAGKNIDQILGDAKIADIPRSTAVAPAAALSSFGVQLARHGG